MGELVNAFGEPDSQSNTLHQANIGFDRKDGISLKLMRAEIHGAEKWQLRR
ncbi:hypothetical protein D3C76_1837050 [compost metagenome]